MIGKTVGKYRVVDRLGRGGMGTVYRAMDEMLHREVAIKVLNAELNDPEVARRFRAEAITVARLSHPGIATIYELFEHEGEWLMVMEFVRGETLEGMVTRMGPLSPQRAAELCMQALAALAHAHSMGVVHRDLKPANLMITENGAVKVMDFGIARVSGSEHLTNAGFMMGTPAYMAPEQVKGGDIDARADLYAMGVVFYRLTTAALPFKGDTPFALAQSQVNDPPTPVGLVREDLPGWVEEVVTRALAKDPEQRFQSAVEFHEAFARSLAGLTLSSMHTPHSGFSTLTPSRPMPSGAFAAPAAPSLTGAVTVPVSTGSLPTMAAPGSPRVSAPTDPTMAAPSGATQIPVRPGPPVPPAAAAGRQKTSPVVWMGVAGAAVIVLAAAAYFFRGGSAPPPEPTPTPAAIEMAAPSPSPDVAAAESPVAPPPAAAPAIVAPPAAASPSPAPAKAKVTGAAPPAAAASKAAATPTPSAMPGTAGAAAGAKPADDPLVTFPDVKLYVVTGKKADDKDAVLNFAGGQLLVMPSTGGAAMASLPYKRITKATYVRARSPKWDPALASPPEGLDIGSVMGTLMRTSRHWLVLQGADYFEILRLEDNNFSRILNTFEARTGLKVDRPN